MRKFIIDTDTASDDCAALMLAALEPEIEILGVTTVSGNVDVRLATKNALMTLEVCGRRIPVYPGAAYPLFGEKHDAAYVHGKDGLGDCDLAHPKAAAEQQHAVDFILETVRRYPDEIEIVALGPVTNLALAIMRDRETMRHVKHIWSMGTAGLGVGNTSPVSEFNVFCDPVAYQRMLESDIPITVVGFDLCTDGAALRPADLEIMANGTPVSRFLEQATRCALRHNRKTGGREVVDLPDAIAMAAALWENIVTAQVPCHAVCQTAAGDTFAQVIFYQKGRAYGYMPPAERCNATLVLAIDEEGYRRRLLQTILQ